MIFPLYAIASLLKAYHDFILVKTEYVLFEKDIKIIIFEEHIMVTPLKIIIFL